MVTIILFFCIRRLPHWLTPFFLLAQANGVRNLILSEDSVSDRYSLVVRFSLGHTLRRLLLGIFSTGPTVVFSLRVLPK